MSLSNGTSVGIETVDLTGSANFNNSEFPYTFPFTLNYSANFNNSEFPYTFPFTLI